MRPWTAYPPETCPHPVERVDLSGTCSACGTEAVHGTGGPDLSACPPSDAQPVRAVDVDLDHGPDAQPVHAPRLLDVVCPTCWAPPRYACQDDAGENCAAHPARVAAARVDRLARVIADEPTRAKPVHAVPVWRGSARAVLALARATAAYDALAAVDHRDTAWPSVAVAVPAAWMAPAGTPAPDRLPPDPSSPWRPVDASAMPALRQARRELQPVDLVITATAREVAGMRLAGEELQRRPETSTERAAREADLARLVALLPRDRGPAQDVERRTRPTWPGWSDPLSGPRTAAGSSPGPATPGKAPRARLADEAPRLPLALRPDARTVDQERADSRSTAARFAAGAFRAPQDVGPITGRPMAEIRARIAADLVEDQVAARVLDAGRWHRHTYAAHWPAAERLAPAAPVAPVDVDALADAVREAGTWDRNVYAVRREVAAVLLDPPRLSSFVDLAAGPQDGPEEAPQIAEEAPGPDPYRGAPAVDLWADAQPVHAPNGPEEPRTGCSVCPFLTGCTGNACSRRRREQRPAEAPQDVDRPRTDEAPPVRVTVTGRGALAATYRPPSPAQVARDAAARAAATPVDRVADDVDPRTACPEHGETCPGPSCCCRDLHPLTAQEAPPVPDVDPCPRGVTACSALDLCQDGPACLADTASAPRSPQEAPAQDVTPGTAGEAPQEATAGPCTVHAAGHCAPLPCCCQIPAVELQAALRAGRHVHRARDPRTAPQEAPQDRPRADRPAIRGLFAQGGPIAERIRADLVEQTRAEYDRLVLGDPDAPTLPLTGILSGPLDWPQDRPQEADRHTGPRWREDPDDECTCAECGPTLPADGPQEAPQDVDEAGPPAHTPGCRAAHYPGTRCQEAPLPGIPDDWPLPLAPAGEDPWSGPQEARPGCTRWQEIRDTDTGRERLTQSCDCNGDTCPHDPRRRPQHVLGVDPTRDDTGPIITAIRLGPGRLFVAPLGTMPPHEVPVLCPMAPYADTGTPWRDVGALVTGGLSFDLPELAGDLYDTAHRWPPPGTSGSVDFRLDEPAAAAMRRLMRALDERDARRTRAHARTAMRALRRRAAAARRRIPYTGPEA